MMIWFGIMTGAHAPAGWRIRRMHFQGILITSVIGLQIITGYLLYYTGHEMACEIAKWTRIVSGICLPAILFIHIRSGRKRAGRARPSVPGIKCTVLSIFRYRPARAG